MSKISCFNLIFGCALLIGIVLFSLSFSTVPTNNVGVTQQIYTKNIDTKSIYYPGIYMVGIQNKFITYPLYYQSLVFSNQNSTININQQSNVVSNTLDGTQISFSAIIYYSYLPEMIGSLSKEYPTISQHTQTIAKTAKTLMAAVINAYNYNDFLTNRVAINTEMSFYISQQFAQSFYVKFKLLLITNIELEVSHEQALITTVLLKQGEISAIANNTINSIQATINLLTAQTNNKIASTTRTAQIQSASQTAKSLLLSEQLKMNTTMSSLAKIRTMYANDTAYISCLQMINLFLNDRSPVVWNSDFIK